MSTHKQTRTPIISIQKNFAFFSCRENRTVDAAGAVFDCDDDGGGEEVASSEGVPDDASVVEDDISVFEGSVLVSDTVCVSVIVTEPVCGDAEYVCDDDDNDDSEGSEDDVDTEVAPKSLNVLGPAEPRSSTVSRKLRFLKGRSRSRSEPPEDVSLELLLLLLLAMLL